MSEVEIIEFGFKEHTLGGDVFFINKNEEVEVFIDLYFDLSLMLYKKFNLSEKGLVERLKLTLLFYKFLFERVYNKEVELKYNGIKCELDKLNEAYEMYLKNKETSKVLERVFSNGIYRF